jgi:hypothetical protein
MSNHTHIPHKENPNTEDNSTLNNSPWAKEIYESHPKIPYTICHKEFNGFTRITKEYSRYIGVLPINPLLPPRRRIVRPIVIRTEHDLIHKI